MSKTKLVFEVCVIQDKNSVEHFVSSVMFYVCIIQDKNFVEHFVSSVMFDVCYTRQEFSGTLCLMSCLMCVLYKTRIL